MIKYERRLGLDMCVKCHRCNRPYYCKARMIDIRNQGYGIKAQRLLDVGCPHPMQVLAQDCLYNYNLIADCSGCKPFKHYSSCFIETPLNSTKKNEEVNE
jgi:hypothetical protein